MTDPAPTRLVTGAPRRAARAWPTARELVDGMSSWWAAIHGYRTRRWTRRCAGQLDRLRARDVRRAHPRAGDPAGRSGWSTSRPTGLEHVFLADSGSVSVEVALKMALQYQRGVGRPGAHPDADDPRRLPRRHVRRMSVCDPVGGMHSMFAEVLPQQVFAPRPPAAGGRRRRLGRRRSERWPPSTPTSSPAIIVEPLLQGAGGMYVYARGVPARDARGRRRARPASWSSTRSPPASAAPARCSPPRPPGSPPTSCAWARR